MSLAALLVCERSDPPPPPPRVDRRSSEEKMTEELGEGVEAAPSLQEKPRGASPRKKEGRQRRRRRSKRKGGGGAEGIGGGGYSHCLVLGSARHPSWFAQHQLESLVEVSGRRDFPSLPCAALSSPSPQAPARPLSSLLLLKYLSVFACPHPSYSPLPPSSPSLLPSSLPTPCPTEHSGA
eukprot:760064-Hanusia_phi.AAC.2